MGHRKHLLNVQYRMHPSISLFPNWEFYSRQILDAPNVKEKSYHRSFLQGDLYGSYSFINIAFGSEDMFDGHSLRNMVEVAAVCDIIARLFKGMFLRKVTSILGLRKGKRREEVNRTPEFELKDWYEIKLHFFYVPLSPIEFKQISNQSTMVD